MLNQCKNLIEKSPTAFHAVKMLREQLGEHGFQPLATSSFSLKAGDKYYIERNESALLAFEMPKETPKRFLITAAHTDSPCFRIRDNAEIQGKYTTLSVERYGGAINHTWFDRPLSIAGRVMIRTKNGIRSELVDLQKDRAVIPNVAIHLHPDLNKNPGYQPAKDFNPLFGMQGDLKAEFAKELGCKKEEILSTDVFLYNNQPATVWGEEDEFFSAPRLDDLASVAACLDGFFSADNEDSVKVLCAFDHEEIGSGTYPGAASDFLPTLIAEICEAMGITGLEKEKILSQSMLLSCDNAHALHPNHPEMSDRNEAPILNGGVVIKHSPRYTTNAVTSGVVEELCRRHEIGCQHYSNRADKPGGSTLGNFVTTKVGMMAADIGIPQLAMHSAFETCGAKDIEDFAKLIRAFYGLHFLKKEHEFTF